MGLPVMMARALAVTVVLVLVAPPMGAAAAATAAAAASVAGQTETGSSVRLDVALELETARGPHVGVEQLRGLVAGAFVHVHEFGTIQAMGPNGRVLWSRGAMTLGRELTTDLIYLPPRVLLGYQGRQPWAVGDVTGDGVDDVVVAHVLYAEPGGNNDWHTVVSVLDGRNGVVVWTRRFDGHVSTVLLRDGLLLIGHETGDTKPGGIGEDGSVSTLVALRLNADADGSHALTDTTAWSHSTGNGWALWTAMTLVGDDSLAASYTPPGAPATATTLFMDVATGAVRWRTEDAGIPRFLVHDAKRGEIAVAQTDAALSVDFQVEHLEAAAHYTLYALAVGDGARRELHGEAATLLAFDLGDATGDGDMEWIVTSVGASWPYGVQHSRVTALDATGRPLWVHHVDGGLLPEAARPVAPLVPAGPPAVPGTFGPAFIMEPALTLAGGLVVSGARVLVTSEGPLGPEVRAIHGATGVEAWRVAGEEVAFALNLAHYDHPATPAVLTVSEHQIVRAYAVEDGQVLLDAPIVADLYAADAADVNGDGVKDLLVGGESRAIFALDGMALDAENPRILWMTRLPGEVHAIELADVDGDGAVDLVAAVGAAVVVLDVASGQIMRRHDAPDRGFVWTFTLADLDDDGATDVVVPAGGVRAYDGASGELAWAYEPDVPPHHLAVFSNAAVTPGGRIVAQHRLQRFTHVQEADALTPSLRAVHQETRPGVSPAAPLTTVAVDGRTGHVEWKREAPNRWDTSPFWNAAASIAAWPGADGEAVALVVDRAPEPVDGVAVHPAALGEFSRFVEVVDARNGGTVDQTSVTGSRWMGFAKLAEDRLVALHYDQATLVAPAGSKTVSSRAVLSTAAFSDVTSATVADIGPVTAWTGLGAMGVATDMFDDPVDGALMLVGTTPGRAVARDLDGDGTDEILGMSENDRALFAVTYGFNGQWGWSIDVGKRSVFVATLTVG